MARLARIVAPGLPHHITQRGNRRAQIFFTNEDYRVYLARLQNHAARRGVTLLAYCLMPNHSHLVCIPATGDALGNMLRDTHAAYATYRNQRESCTGHLWQGRFFSCVLDEAHLWAAIRYVERNPVRAGLVKTAPDYPWSSAPAHCGLLFDPLLSMPPFLAHPAPDWAAWLADDDAGMVETLRRLTQTGRPLGSAEFLTGLETRLGRPVTPGKRGPKPAAKADQGNN